MTLSARELAAVLGGLRLLQLQGTEALAAMDHFAADDPLDEQEIDDLCERLNLEM